MGIKEVREYFRGRGMEGRIMELKTSTATVPLAAAAHGVQPGQIGKTLSFKVGDESLLIVVAGDVKIANAKYKARFSKKAKMLSADEVLEYTGHAVGGVCPFGLPEEMPVYLDVSLKRFDEVIPAAGSSDSSIRLSIAELEEYSGFREWVDVCKSVDS